MLRVLNNCFAFDGVDGVGKTTMISKIKTHFETLGYDVVVLASPSKEVKNIIREDNKNLDRVMKALLEDALSKSIHLLKPFDEINTIYLLDRWTFYTSFGYQVAVTNDLEGVKRWIDSAITSTDIYVMPVKCFILECPIDVSWSRQANEGINNDTKDFQLRVKNNYETLLHNYENIVRIDTTNNPNESLIEVIQLIKEQLYDNFAADIS